MKYARSTEDKQNKLGWQTLPDHLAGVTKLAEGFASPFGAEPWARAAGLLHDIGKVSVEFQRRLEGGPVVDHGTAGAKEAIQRYGNQYGMFLGYTICGHHGGLPDGGNIAEEGSLIRRLGQEIPDYSSWERYLPKDLPERAELKIPYKVSKSKLGFQTSFYIRMLYSSLVDADALDAERAMDQEASALRADWTSLDLVQDKMSQFLQSQKERSADTPINRRRTEIREHVTELAKKEKGLFSLTVPTGGGKTQISLDFAMKHAKEHDLKRIIYVIPYTSIIDQNAQVFRNILGDEIVLEHHSNVAIEDFNSKANKELLDDGATFKEKCRLASENWDAPLVVTTSVQALESLFAHKPSRCRKLHRMANSILIFDEAQMIPTKFLRPALAAMEELVGNYGSTVVLCTATQPAWDRVRNQGQENEIDLLGDRIIQELAPEPKELYEEFRRVKAEYIGEQADDELTSQLVLLEQVLCIVNTRRHSQNLFSLLKEKLSSKEGLYHLSTRMCPHHRREKLKKIRSRLDQGLACRVISTQLIEAGVDVDFPTVYRSSAGVDSIVQAAGRCNREQKRKEGHVFVFKPKNKKDLPPGLFSRSADIAEEIFREFEDPLCLKAVESYFQRLYAMNGRSSLDGANILGDLEEKARTLLFDFPKIAKDFQLIDSATESLIVPWSPFFSEKEVKTFGDCLFEIEKTIYNEISPVRFARKMQPITIQVYKHELEKLESMNLVNCYQDREKKNGYWVLTDESTYDSEQGLTLRDSVEDKVYIF